MLRNNRYPIYIVSKGRWGKRFTADSLERMGVPYYIIVEGQEYKQYAAYVDGAKILILDKSYQDQYDTFDNLAGTKGKGPGAARNFAWDHSVSLGAKRHWVLDDNVQGFYRLNKNHKNLVETGAIFRAAEDFVDRYENVPIAGFNYCKFCKPMDRIPPFYLNTRVYSMLLIENAAPYRWRGRYNEDTDLCLRVLKDGYCTIQFNAFLGEKITTQRITGGNTAEFYEKEGTLNKSQMLVDMHPDVVSLVWKFHRWHHHVNYKVFQKNKLIKKEGLVISNCVNNYGMKLVEL